MGRIRVRETDGMRAEGLEQMRNGLWGVGAVNRKKKIGESR